MVKMMVKQGCTLLYPDGSRRGGAGYVVDDEASHEGHALAGQRDKLEPCAAFISSDAAVIERLAAPHAEPVSLSTPPKKKASKKKAKKKKAKKKARRG
jgi:hypothetical protein